MPRARKTTKQDELPLGEISSKPKATRPRKRKVVEKVELAPESIVSDVPNLETVAAMQEARAISEAPKIQYDAPDKLFDDLGQPDVAPEPKPSLWQRLRAWWNR